MYGANTLNTTIEGIGEVGITQETDYPWDGKIKLTINKLKGKKKFAIALRIPEWADEPAICNEGHWDLMTKEGKDGNYITTDRTWKKGDTLTINLPMKTRLIEANPLVEECRVPAGSKL